MFDSTRDLFAEPASAWIGTGQTTRFIIAGVLAFGCGQTVRALEPPAMKAGLWVIQSRTTRQPSGEATSTTSTLCRDRAYDDRQRQLALKLLDTSGQCSVVKDTRNHGTYTLSTHCELGGVSVDSQSVTTYLRESTHTETHQQYTPALDGVTEVVLVEDERYLGPCPIGSKPGDMFDDRGQQLNEASSR